jgi:flagellar biosynthesis protein FlhF
MNVQRFTARTSREAMALVREAFGEDAIVLSSKPCPEGVEMLAMAPEDLQHIEKISKSAPRAASARSGPASRAFAETQPPRQAAAAPAPAPRPAAEEVQVDVEKLSMSTLSFQDYVRERMLKRRQAALQGDRATDAPRHDPRQPVERHEPHFQPEPVAGQPAAGRAAAGVSQAAPAVPVPAVMPQAQAHVAHAAHVAHPAHAADAEYAASTSLAAHATHAVPQPAGAAAAQAMPHAAHVPPVASHPAPLPSHAASPVPAQPHAAHAPLRRDPPVVLREEARADREAAAALAEATALAGTRREQQDMMNELRSMKGLIEDRFGALAFMEKLQRQPAQARLAHKLLDGGLSPALIRKLSEGMAADVADEMAWAGAVLERNLMTGEHDAAIEDQGGVFALVGSTGVGKTTSTAKLAAAFATKHGAGNLGLITLDAYRVAAHEQLRAYGRILGVPVHTAHDRATLEDLLDLLSAKKMVLIDTAGIGQRDARTRELLDMLGHRSIQKLLVVNASAQGETIEDVLFAYRASACAGIVLSKLDEAMKLGPALDAMIRHRLKVVAVANGQRVPEDWHRLSSQALVHRALRAITGSAYRLDASDVSLVFATAHHHHAGASAAAALHA